jgi:hypothetical protein
VVFAGQIYGPPGQGALDLHAQTEKKGALHFRSGEDVYVKIIVKGEEKVGKPFSAEDRKLMFLSALSQSPYLKVRGKQ